MSFPPAAQPQHPEAQSAPGPDTSTSSAPASASVQQLTQHSLALDAPDHWLDANMANSLALMHSQAQAHGQAQGQSQVQAQPSPAQSQPQAASEQPQQAAVPLSLAATQHPHPNPPSMPLASGQPLPQAQQAAQPSPHPASRYQQHPQASLPSQQSQNQQSVHPTPSPHFSFSSASAASDPSVRQATAQAANLVATVGTDLGTIVGRLHARRNLRGELGADDVATVEAAVRQLMSRVEEGVQQLRALSLEEQITTTPSPSDSASHVPAPASGLTGAPQQAQVKTEWDPTQINTNFGGVHQHTPLQLAPSTQGIMTHGSGGSPAATGLASGTASALASSTAHSPTGSAGLNRPASTSMSRAGGSTPGAPLRHRDSSESAASIPQGLANQVPVFTHMEHLNLQSHTPAPIPPQPQAPAPQQPAYPADQDMIDATSIGNNMSFSSSHDPAYGNAPSVDQPMSVPGAYDNVHLSHVLKQSAPRVNSSGARTMSASNLPRFEHSLAASNRRSSAGAHQAAAPSFAAMGQINQSLPRPSPLNPNSFAPQPTAPAPPGMDGIAGPTPSALASWLSNVHGHTGEQQPGTALPNGRFPAPLAAPPTQPAPDVNVSVLQPPPSANPHAAMPGQQGYPYPMGDTQLHPFLQMGPGYGLPLMHQLSGRKSASMPQSEADLVTEIAPSDKRYRNRKLLRDLREYLYRFLNTTEFRLLTETYNVAEWVPHPDAEGTAMTSLPGGAGALAQVGVLPDTRLFHIDFQSKDYYRTNGALMNELIRVGLGLARAQPFEYGVANAGVLQSNHIEDVAKDLMDSARSGFRQAVRAHPAQDGHETSEQKAVRVRMAERAKVKQRERERGAARLRKPIPRQLLISGAYSDDCASDEDLHGLSQEEWRAQRASKLSEAPPDSAPSSPGGRPRRRTKPPRDYEALTPVWRNPALTRAYIAADKRALTLPRAAPRRTRGDTESSSTGPGDLPKPVSRRWRRDQPVVDEIPHALRGRRLPAVLFEKDWLAKHRDELYAAPYYISVDDDPVPGWSESAYATSEPEMSGPESPAQPSPAADPQGCSRRSSSFSRSVPSSGRASAEGSPAPLMRAASNGSGTVRPRSRVVIDEKDTEWAVDDDDDEVDDFIPKMERRRSEKRRRTSAPRPFTPLNNGEPKPFAPLKDAPRSMSAISTTGRDNGASKPPVPLVGMVGRSVSLPEAAGQEIASAPAESKSDEQASNPSNAFDLGTLPSMHLDNLFSGMDFANMGALPPPTPGTAAMLEAASAALSAPEASDPFRTDSVSISDTSRSSVVPSSDTNATSQYHQVLQERHQHALQQLSQGHNSVSDSSGT